MQTFLGNSNTIGNPRILLNSLTHVSLVCCGLLIRSAKYSELYNKDTTIVTIHSTGNVHWGPPATLYTHCEVNLKYYPYDEHECYYKFGSWAHDNSHIDVDLEPNISEVSIHSF